MIFEGVFHCCQDAELIWLIYLSPEESFQITDFFVQCGILKR
jgi:hypothetical protein